jgi:tetratricopeptide (TPR) repeat protein
MFSAILSVLFVFCINAHAHLEGEHELGSVGGVSEEYLNSGIEILPGVGLYEPLVMVSSLPSGAEQDLVLKYTKQGIALNHAFQWEDAVRSFYEAIERDPNMARAYLGLAQAFTMLNRDQTKLSTVLGGLVEQAQEAALKVVDNEQDRLWVDVYQLLYQAQYGLGAKPLISLAAKSFSGSDPSQKLGQALDVLISQYNDPEAFAMLGWDLGDMDMLNYGIQRFPEHSGLIHYLVHINENTGQYQKAVDFARRLVAVTPNAPHNLHMLGHVLPMIGKWDEASTYFLKAHCIHQAVFRVQDPLCAGVMVEGAPLSSHTPAPEEMWHYAHNLELFGFSLMRERRLQDAEVIFSKLCEVGGCQSLFQFYQGEKMYSQVIDVVDKMKTPSATYLFMKAQSLILLDQTSEAQNLLASLPNDGSLEPFAAGLALAWSRGGLSAQQKQSLEQLIERATTNPNFDAWSHLLPVLRKLHGYAEKFNASETQSIYDAVQKIDAGHPL